MSSKPVILFVHGAWHQPAHFKHIMRKFEDAGYRTICPQQPTFGRHGAELTSLSMYDDAACVRDTIISLLEEGQLIVVVMHSYGGVVGSQAVESAFGVRPRESLGKAGGILKLVYMCAFLLPLNASLGDAFGGSLPPFITIHPDGSCEMQDSRSKFYSLLDDITAAKNLELTRPHVAKAQLDRLTNAGYLGHDVAYIVSTQDQALLEGMQRSMIASLEGLEKQVEVYEVAGDHSPYLSKAQDVVAIITRICEDARVKVS